MGSYDDGAALRRCYRNHPPPASRPGLLAAPASSRATAVDSIRPFAQLSSDSYGFALARVAWKLLGAVNAVLILGILRPLSLVGAIFSALSHAVL
jgi:hypothetical protein